MRFTAIALGALAAISGVAAQDPTWTTESTATTTHYLTRTVLRVVQTVYTHNSTTAASTGVAVSTGLHGTGAHSGTAGATTTLATSHAAPTSTSATNAAAAYGVELGAVAIAGLAGLLAL